MASQIEADVPSNDVVEHKKLLNEEIKNTNQPSRPIFGSDLSLHLYEEKKKVDIRKLDGNDYLDMLLGDEEELDVDFVTKEEEYNVGKSYDFSHIECPVFPEFDYEKLDKTKLIEIEEEKLQAAALKEQEISDLEQRLSELSEVEDLPENTDLTVDLMPVPMTENISREPEIFVSAPKKKKSLPSRVVTRVFNGFLIMFGIRKTFKKRQRQEAKQRLERGKAKRFLRDEVLAREYSIDSFSEDELEEDEEKSTTFRHELAPLGDMDNSYLDSEEEEERGEVKRTVGDRFLREKLFPNGLEDECETSSEVGEYEQA